MHINQSFTLCVLCVSSLSRCSEDHHWPEYRWGHLLVVCRLSSSHPSNHSSPRHFHQRQASPLSFSSSQSRCTYLFTVSANSQFEWKAGSGWSTKKITSKIKKKKHPTMSNTSQKLLCPHLLLLLPESSTTKVIKLLAHTCALNECSWCSQAKSTNLQKLVFLFFKNEEQNFFFCALWLCNDWFQGPAGQESHSSHSQTCKLQVQFRERQRINCYMVFTQQRCFVGWNLNDLDGWKLQYQAMMRKSSNSDAKMQF